MNFLKTDKKGQICIIFVSVFLSLPVGGQMRKTDNKGQIGSFFLVCFSQSTCSKADEKKKKKRQERTNRRAYGIKRQEKQTYVLFWSVFPSVPVGR